MKILQEFSIYTTKDFKRQKYFRTRMIISTDRIQSIQSKKKLDRGICSSNNFKLTVVLVVAFSNFDGI